MHLLVKNLRQFATNNFELNVIITGIISFLASISDINMHICLFKRETEIITGGYPSIYDTLEEVSKDMKGILTSSVDYQEALKKTRDDLEVGKIIPNRVKNETERFLINVIVFEEFVKELSALAQVHEFTDDVAMDFYSK